MPQRAWILGLLATLLSFPAQAFAEGKIQHARDEVNQRDQGHDGSHGHHHGHDDDDDDDDGGILGAILCALFSSDDDESHYTPSGDSGSSESSLPSPSYRYASYPYARGHRGYLVRRDFDLAYNGDVQPLAHSTHDYGLQLALEGGYLDGIARADTGVRLLTPVRLELDTRFAFLHESIDHAELGAPDSDATTLGSTHLAYRLFQGEAGMLRIGAGARYMIDAKGADGGFDVLLGVDLFMGRPVVLSLELAAGSLGDAVVFAPRIQLGFMLDRWEIFASYEHLMIGDVELPTPMLGTRLWL